MVPVEHLEVVCNGVVVATLGRAGGQDEGDFDGSIPISRSGWCLLRADSTGAAYPVLDNYIYGTTSPVYLRVGEEGPRSPEDARFFVAWIDRVIETTSAYPDWRSAEEKASVLARLRQAQGVYRSLQ